jgi:zinc protease
MIKPFVSAVLVAVGLVVASSHAHGAGQRSGAGSATTLAPVIVKRQLSNGLRVWIVEQHELPVVQMSLLVLTGTDADPRGRYGVASLASAMLTEGAGSRSGVEMADALDALVANLSASSTVDSSSLQLYVPVAGFAEALPLVADAAQRPTFPKAPLETLRQQRLVTLRNARGDPDAIAALAFARAIYGPSNRSAAALIGTAESIEALTPEALRAFHDAAYRPDNCALIVVGDVGPEQVQALLETHFGK